MSTVLSRQDIINIIYGATVLGAGGGGSASSGLEMLENYIKKHGDPKLRMISTGEMNVNAYAAVTAGMGSPVALKDIDFTPYAVNAYNALVDMAATMGRTLSYTIPVEIGGFNTFVPMLIAMMNDIPVIDADGAARAVPALDTLLLHVNGLDTSPLAMADHKNNRLTIELADPRDAHEAEVIGRNICVAFDMMAGLSGWMDSMDIDPKYLDGDYLVNLDWETLGSLCNSCAGGDFFNYSHKAEWEKPIVGCKALTISFSGLLGGHSGVGINKGHANALVSIATLLAMRYFP